MKPLAYKTKPVKGQCSALYCKIKVAGNTKLCGQCRSRKSRLSDPIRYAYQNLKDHAKARNVIFTIELADFRNWCIKVSYTGFYGRTKESFDIDRRYNDIGYHIDNIQVLKKVDNIKKYFYYDYRTKQAIMLRAEPVQEGPF